MLTFALFLALPATVLSSVGVAFSGGGLPGSVSALCYFELMELLSTFPNVTLSTVSGGTIGYTVAAQKRRLTYPPALYSDSAHKTANYKEMNSKMAAPGFTWFGVGITAIPVLSEAEVTADFDERNFLDDVNASPGQWWISAIDFALRSYNFSLGTAVLPATPPSIIGYTALLQGAGPATRNRATHGSDNAMDALTYVTYDHRNKKSDGRLPIGKIELATAIGASTAFWAGPIVGGATVPYHLGRGRLLQAPSPTGAKAGALYATDGGQTDTTGIVGLLQRRTTRIILFYENAKYLDDNPMALSFLFGVVVLPIKGSAQLQGPVLSQVFPSNLWDRVYNALIDSNAPTGPIVHLQNVPVMANKFFQVPAYTIDELVIVGNHGSKTFVSELDTSIVQRISKDWPSNFVAKMSTLDVNLLCSYSGWKVRRNLQLLARVLRE